MSIPYRPLSRNDLIIWIPSFSRRISLFVFLLVFSLVLYILIVGSNTRTMVVSENISTRYTLEEMQTFALRNSLSKDYKPGFYTRGNLPYEKMIADKKSRFNITGQDILVFLHIQKTAGTSFEKFLVRNLNIEHPCVCTRARKRCSCKRPGSDNQIWLFSRYSTGWACGLHADFTELLVEGCVDNSLDKKEGEHYKRRYFYTSFLREPITRFISEYRHVNRGGTWSGSRHMCNGRPPTPRELPFCFDPSVRWSGVTLHEFLSCPYNLAFNRQTRMLADLTRVGCYDTSTMDSSTRDRLLLESAKDNLRNLAFFGLKERMEDSQWMYERLFGMRFTKSLAEWSKSKSNDTRITDEEMERIKDVNRLDTELYKYAAQLFEERFRRMKQQDWGVSRMNFLDSQTFAPVIHNNTQPLGARTEWREEEEKPKKEEKYDEYEEDEEEADRYK